MIHFESDAIATTSETSPTKKLPMAATLAHILRDPPGIGPPSEFDIVGVVGVCLEVRQRRQTLYTAIAIDTAAIKKKTITTVVLSLSLPSLCAGDVVSAAGGFVATEPRAEEACTKDVGASEAPFEKKAVHANSVVLHPRKIVLPLLKKYVPTKGSAAGLRQQTCQWLS